MKINTYNFRDWDESNRTFVDEFKSHVPDKFRSLIVSLIEAPFGETMNMPSISTFMLYLDNIKKLSSEEDNMYISTNIERLVSLFTVKEIHTFNVMNIIVPQFNLYHHGNICHLNVCINILSSLYYLIEAMTLPNKVTYEFDVLRKCIMNSLSPIDLNPKLIISLISMLRIDITKVKEADETFKKLMKILYQSIKTDMIFFWDSTDKFVIDPDDKKIPVGNLIDKYNPKYLIVNTQDFNIITNVESNSSTMERFSTLSNKYVLESIVIACPLHFISAFKVDDTFIIRDDLQHRFFDSYIDISKITNTIVLSCYVRV